jgi:hypothetical protein
MPLFSQRDGFRPKTAALSSKSGPALRPFLTQYRSLAQCDPASITCWDEAQPNPRPVPRLMHEMDLAYQCSPTSTQIEHRHYP